MTKKKKIILSVFGAVAAVILTAFLVILSVCIYSNGQYLNEKNCIRKAQKKYGFENISYCGLGCDESALCPKSTVGLVYYVIGEVDGAEKVMVATGPKQIVPFVTDWVLDTPFSEITELLEQESGRKIERREDGLYNAQNLYFLESRDSVAEHFPNAQIPQLDVELAVTYEYRDTNAAGESVTVRYACVQSNGELVFITQQGS